MPHRRHLARIIGLRRRRARIIAMLRRKISHLGQAANPAQQELQLPVRRTGYILWYLVAGEIDCYPCESALRVCYAHDAAASHKTDGGCGDRLVFGLVDDEADGGVVGHEEGGGGLFGEALLAVPGHIVEGHECAVGEEEEVEEARADDDVVGALDDGGEGGVG